MVKNINLLICIMLMLLILSSCTPNNSAPSTSSVVIDDTSCQPPCWRNITMGMSSDEVKPLLENMQDISQKSLGYDRDNRRFYTEAYFWEFIYRNEAGGDILFRESKVIEIDFDFSQAPIPLSTLIKKFGEPEKILITKGRLDSTILTAYIIYMEKGICLVHKPDLWFSYPDQYSIKTSTNIDEISYIDPVISEGQTKIGCLVDPDNLPFVQAWKGYGIYSVHESGSKP